MDVCQKRIDVGLNFVGKCVNITNNWLNRTERDYEKSSNKNAFILCAGLIVTLILENRLLKKGTSSAIFSAEIKLRILTTLLSLFTLVISLILSPIIITIFAICFTYRSIINCILKYEFGSRYIGLLEGTDVVWAIEDVSRSVINILAVIKTENVANFKEKLTKKMLGIVEDPKYAKLKCSHLKKYGYYFWITNNLNIKDQINYLPILPHEKSISKEELIEISSKYNNKLLPRNHTTCWEILIGQQPLKTDENHYPILFRFHHTVGDGIGLLKILLEASDNQTNEHNLTKNNKTITSFVRTLLSIIFAPAHLIRMNLAKNIDNNILHGKELSGEKVLAWISENKDFSILENIKYIKSQFLGVTFLDVVLMGLSQTFYDYFKQKNTETPPTITSVVLERADKICPTEFSRNFISPLQNRFTLAMATLPIFPVRSSNFVHHTGNDFEMVERLQEVNRQMGMLRDGPDYQINYWLLTVVSKLLPEFILRPMLHSAHSTMVVSNIRGPEKVNICDGDSIENLIFWLPHRGLTGIGISVLSYAGRLQIGMSVDKALISNSTEAESILQNFVQNLKIFSDHLKLKSTDYKKIQKCNTCNYNITYLFNK